VANEERGGRREAARIAAVQALYQIEMSGAPATDVIVEFRDHRLDGSADDELFSAIVAIASTRGIEIDDMLATVLAEGWSVGRLDAVVRALLRAGVGEMIEHKDVPIRVLIDQYLEVAHSFVGEKERGFINGVLDRLARRLRPQEIEAPRAGKSAQKR
jgi:N utilization substance protein B